MQGCVEVFVNNLVQSSQKKNFRICIQIPDHKSMENAR